MRQVNTMEPIRTLIADDHPLYRDGLRTMLERAPETEIVGEAASGDEAITMADALQPDVVLMDVQMPTVNGVEATRRIVQASPHIGVLMLTMFADDDSVFAAMRAGARGYLLKGAERAEVLRAIQVVASGEAIFSPMIAQRLTRYFATLALEAQPKAFPELTDRERAILDLIAQGRNNAEIANRLVLSPKTVRNHVSNILSKLQVADRAQAIIQARQAGMG
jgi:DNA-binding NarL/FixJ family response regulator